MHKYNIMSRLFITLIFILCISCTQQNSKIPNDSLISNIQEIDYAYAFISKLKNWNVVKDKKTALLKNKDINHPISTVMIKAVRLDNELTNENFADSLILMQVINGADINSFAKKKISNNNQVSFTEITQNDFSIIVKTITKNNVGYAFVCMGTQDSITVNECVKLFELVYIN
jgi:hypothetical protein